MSETKVTEFGVNPDGTLPGGTGDGPGVGEANGVAVGRIGVGDGDGLGCGVCVTGPGEHAARKRQPAAATSAHPRFARTVRVITAENGVIDR